jgi:cupin fold WbuC family metalloprotein
MRVITEETIAELLSRAFASPRKRTNLNLHHELSDPTNRFLNAGIAGTYVRPHRHRIGKWELLSVMQGSVDVMTFSADGAVKNRVSLSAAGASEDDPAAPSFVARLEIAAVGKRV